MRFENRDALHVGFLFLYAAKIAVRGNRTEKPILDALVDLEPIIRCEESPHSSFRIVALAPVTIRIEAGGQILDGGIEHDEIISLRYKRGVELELPFNV